MPMDAACDRVVSDASTSEATVTESLLSLNEGVVFRDPMGEADAGRSSSMNEERDGSVSDALPSDASSIVGAFSSTFAFEARVLAASTCHGRTLRLPDSFRQRGLVAWHFCYVTEDPRVAADAGHLTVRPASVRFEVGRDGSLSLEPMVSASAPRTANPWTSSVAVALPDTIMNPRFNVRNDFLSEGGGAVWALDQAANGNLLSRGMLRAWRVDAEGQQTEVPLQPLFSICGGTMGPSAYPAGNYVPQGMCPAVLAMCAPGPYHCQR